MSDDTNTAFVSLIASDQVHGIEPTADCATFSALPRWPLSDIIALTPAHWKKNFEHDCTGSA